MVLTVRVIPGAKATEIVAWTGPETIKIRLRALPIEGRANEELIRFLGRRLKVPKTQITVLRGATGRNKWIEFPDMDWGVVRGLLR